jgi:hypothetical protein
MVAMNLPAMSTMLRFVPVAAIQFFIGRQNGR